MLSIYCKVLNKFTKGAADLNLESVDPEVLKETRTEALCVRSNKPCKQHK